MTDIGNSTLEPAIADALHDLYSQLDEVHALQAAATDASDRDEAAAMAQELRKEITRIMYSYAKEQCNLVIAPAPLLQAPPGAVVVPSAADHQVRWDDGKTYSCQVSALLFNNDAKSILALLEIFGFPANKRETVPVGAVSQWGCLGFPAAAFAESVLRVGAKVFAVSDDADGSGGGGDDGVFWLPAVVIEVKQPGGAPIPIAPQAMAKVHVVVEFLPPAPGATGTATAAAAATTVVVDHKKKKQRTLPATHLRPYSSAPPLGKTLRRRFENMSEAERKEFEEEKKQKKEEQAAKQRRQREDKIQQDASNWNQMKAMMGGGAGGKKKKMF